MKRKSWIKNLSIMAMVVCACLGQSRADTLYYDDFSGDSGSPLPTNGCVQPAIP